MYERQLPQIHVRVVQNVTRRRSSFGHFLFVRVEFEAAGDIALRCRTNQTLVIKRRQNRDSA